MLKYPTDSLGYRYFVAQNLLYSRQFDKGMKAARELMGDIEKGKTSSNPDLPFLVADLLGENYYYSGRRQKAREIYQALIPKLGNMEDKFRRAWIYLHYGRLLRSLGYYEQAKDMFNKAGDVDDDYTRLIVSREKYMLEKLKEAMNKK